MKTLKTSIFISTLLLVTSCATIVNGSKQTVSVNTNVSSATVSIDGVKKTTPAVFELKGSSSGYLVQASKPGYENNNGKIDSNFRFVPTILGNILWPVVGIVVDLVTGSAYELDKAIEIELSPKSGSKKAVSKD